MVQKRGLLWIKTGFPEPMTLLIRKAQGPTTPDQGYQLHASLQVMVRISGYCHVTRGRAPYFTEQIFHRPGKATSSEFIISVEVAVVWGGRIRSSDSGGLDDNLFCRCAISCPAFDTLLGNGIQGGQAFVGDLAEVGVDRW